MDMLPFQKTTHLSEILEKSEIHPVIIFKYSSECGSSTRLSNALEKAITEKKVTAPIYIVVVQEHPALSQKIAEHFSIQHESPQILIVNHGKVTYSADHDNINLEDFTFK